MTLEEWRKDAGWSYARLALALGVTKSAARRYCLPRGHPDARDPRVETRVLIRNLTQGRVALD